MTQSKMLGPKPEDYLQFLRTLRGQSLDQTDLVYRHSVLHEVPIFLRRFVVDWYQVPINIAAATLALQIPVILTYEPSRTYQDYTCTVRTAVLPIWLQQYYTYYQSHIPSAPYTVTTLLTHFQQFYNLYSSNWEGL
jgi:hypothetical protein